MPSPPGSHRNPLGLSGSRAAASSGEEARKMGSSGGPCAASEKQAMLIRGAMGPDAKLINGLYELQAPGLSPVFRARGGAAAPAGGAGEAGVWLYRAENGTWCVSGAEAKDARAPVCWAYKAGDLLCPATWQVAVGDAWEAQQLSVQPMSSREVAALCKDLAERASLWAARLSAPKAAALPYDALAWTQQECELWFRTHGRLHPRDGAHRCQHASRLDRAGPRRKRVSVITPTTESRQAFHEKLWACFEAQDWPDKELVVVETYQHQSSACFAALAGNRQLTYISRQVPAGEDWSIGLKRNICVHFATGDYIVHFDDDDLYAVRYISTMIRALGPRSLGAKLSSWYIFDRASNSFGFCDPELCGREQQLPEELIRQRVYGYGFSYTFRREAFERLQFEDVCFGEDIKFVFGLLHLEGPGCIALVKDEYGLCMHMQHGHNTSQTGCVMLKTLQWDQVCDLDFADLPLVFDGYLESFGRAEEKRLLRAGPAARQPGRRLREVLVHAPVGSLRLRFPAGALGGEVLARVEERLGDLPLGTQIWWAPPPSQGSEAERDQALQQAIRNLLPGFSKPGGTPATATEEREELLARVAGPVPRHGRIGARTTELWLSVPGRWRLEGDPARGQEVRLRVSRTSPSVCVTCEELPSRESVSTVFHLELPMDATVDDLRRALGARLPEWAEVLARRPGRGRVALKDSEPLPDKVTLTDFAGAVTADMVLTKGQVREFMALLLQAVRSARVQQILDGFQAETRMDEGLYRAKLAFLLLDEVYPAVASHFELPRSCSCMMALKQTVTAHMQGDVDMFATAVELEECLRNRQAAEDNAATWRYLLAQRAAGAAAAAAAAAAVDTAAESSGAAG
uniref:Glycosyltransferase 2-like domain-containing protein n=1 Tax=Alexandrium monilatum TaxID=311494 RepID=A0A7S4SCM7_9DINO